MNRRLMALGAIVITVIGGTFGLIEVTHDNGVSASKINVVTGTSKNEVIRGTLERDRIFAAKGNDRVGVRGGSKDSVFCGKGFDKVWLDHQDLSRDCEVKVFPKPKSTPPIPPPPPVSPPGGDLFGMVADSANDHSDAIRVADSTGVKLLRVEFEVGDPASRVVAKVDEMKAHGIEVIPQAGWGGRIPSADESRNMGVWAHALVGKVRWIEFGNETSFTYFGTQGEGAAYAHQFVIAHDSMAGTGIGLLAQADDADNGPGWVNAMFDAVPNLDELTAGWTVHPYGPSWRDKINRLISQTNARGGDPNVPIFITEWGIATDNGAGLNANYGWPTNMTYAQAGDAFNREVHAMFSEYPRIKAITMYESQDLRPSGTGEREDYFGAVKKDFGDKTGLTDDIRGLAHDFS